MWFSNCFWHQVNARGFGVFANLPSAGAHATFAFLLIALPLSVPGRLHAPYETSPLPNELFDREGGGFSIGEGNIFLFSSSSPSLKFLFHPPSSREGTFCCCGAGASTLIPSLGVSFEILFFVFSGYLHTWCIRLYFWRKVTSKVTHVAHSVAEAPNGFRIVWINYFTKITTYGLQNCHYFWNITWRLWLTTCLQKSALSANRKSWGAYMHSIHGKKDVRHVQPIDYQSPVDLAEAHPCRNGYYATLSPNYSLP